MLTASILLVVTSGMMHAVWNMLVKQCNDKKNFLWLILVPVTVVLLPFFFREALTEALPARAYLFVVLTMIAQAAYAMLLAKTYEVGEMSQVYPLMRGTSTLLIPVLGVVFWHESLSWLGWLGLIGIAMGFIVVSGRGRAKGGNEPLGKPVWLALCVGLCTTGYVLLDKVNLGYWSPMALLGISNVGFMLGLLPSILQVSNWRKVIAGQRKTLAFGALLSPGSYFLFLVALQYAPVAHLSPIREVGTVFGTCLAIFVLKEKQGTRRIVSAVVIASGIVMIGIFG